MSSSNNIPFLPQNYYFSPDYEQYLLQITELYPSIAQGINQREIAMYDTVEQPTGQTWFSQNRQAFRTVYNFPAPLGASNTVAHGLGSLTNFEFTAIFGTINNPTTPLFAPINQAGANGTSVEIGVTNITLTIPAAYQGANFSAIVTLEYLKN